jgi:hypothetical protein
MSTAPLTFTWTDDGVMRPLLHLAKEADRRFVVGLNYRLEIIEQRSKQSHDHFFAVVDDAHANLPEVHKNRWLTPDDLRKWALIQAGFCKETTYIAQSKAEAVRIASFMHSTVPFSEVEVHGNLVALRTPKTQKTTGPEAMDRKEFQASKSGVLEVLAKLLDVTPDELAKQGNAA